MSCQNYEYSEPREFNCNCIYAGIHHPKHGYCCGLIGCNHIGGEDDEYVSCEKVRGSDECKKHAVTCRDVRITFPKPLYPNDFVGLEQSPELLGDLDILNNDTVIRWLKLRLDIQHQEIKCNCGCKPKACGTYDCPLPKPIKHSKQNYARKQALIRGLQKLLE